MLRSTIVRPPDETVARRMRLAAGCWEISTTMASSNARTA
jgi:hypothetical protein